MKSVELIVTIKELELLAMAVKTENTCEHTESEHKDLSDLSNYLYEEIDCRRKSKEP